MDQQGLLLFACFLMLHFRTLKADIDKKSLCPNFTTSSYRSFSRITRRAHLRNVFLWRDPKRIPWPR